MRSISDLLCLNLADLSDRSHGVTSDLLGTADLFSRSPKITEDSDVKNQRNVSDLVIEALLIEID